jgi:general nucleoside transport system permease protein
MIKRIGYALAAPVIAAVVAIALSSVVLIISDADPITAFKAVIEYGTRLETNIEALNRATALYLSAIALSIAYRMKLFNIGVEGQYVLGAFMGAAVGGAINLPPVLHVAVIMLTSMLVGAAWAGLAAMMKVTRNVHEVISTIMLNVIAVSGIVAYLLSTWKIEDASLDTQLADIPTSGWVPGLNGFLELFTREIKRVELHGFILVAIAVGILYHLIINKTRLGFDLRATGANPLAAEASGVPPARTTVIAMLMSGAIAGLVGLGQLLGADHNYNLRFALGLGFSGIAVALLGRHHPVGVALAAFLIGWLERASGVLAIKGDAPREIVTIMTGVIILSAVIAFAVVERRRLADAVKKAAAAVPEVAL